MTGKYYVRPVGGCGVTQLSLAWGKILKLLSDKGDYFHYPGQNINRNVVIIFQQGRRNWIMNQIMLILKILFSSPLEGQHPCALTHKSRGVNKSGAIAPPDFVRIEAAAVQPRYAAILLPPSFRKLLTRLLITVMHSTLKFVNRKSNVNLIKNDKIIS